MAIENAFWRSKKNRRDLEDDAIILLEIDYSSGPGHNDDNHTECEFARLANYNEPIDFAGYMWQPFTIAGVSSSASTDGVIGTSDVTFAGIGREIGMILEQYELEHRPGRVLRVHPDGLSNPLSSIEERFVIKRGRVSGVDAVLTVVPMDFDPFLTLLPRRLVTSERYPGIGSARSLRLG